MTAEKEVWKAIQRTNGKIEVSNFGRCRSLLSGRPYVLKPSVDKKGYLRLRVTIDRTKMSFKVHREVAKAFVPNPKNLPQVNHLDGDKNNNSVANLEWVTNAENAHHALTKGLWDSVIAGSKRENERRKKAVVATNLSNGDVIRFESVSSAEKHFGSRHITAVLKRRRTNVRGWDFRYCERGGR